MRYLLSLLLVLLVASCPAAKPGRPMNDGPGTASNANSNVNGVCSALSNLGTAQCAPCDREPACYVQIGGVWESSCYSVTYGETLQKFEYDCTQGKGLFYQGQCSGASLLAAWDCSSVFSRPANTQGYQSFCPQNQAGVVDEGTFTCVSQLCSQWNAAAINTSAIADTVTGISVARHYQGNGDYFLGLKVASGGKLWIQQRGNILNPVWVSVANSSGTAFFGVGAAGGILATSIDAPPNLLVGAMGSGNTWSLSSAGNTAFSSLGATSSITDLAVVDVDFMFYIDSNHALNAIQGSGTSYSLQAIYLDDSAPVSSFMDIAANTKDLFVLSSSGQLYGASYQVSSRVTVDWDTLATTLPTSGTATATQIEFGGDGSLFVLMSDGTLWGTTSIALVSPIWTQVPITGLPASVSVKDFGVSDANTFIVFGSDKNIYQFTANCPSS